MGKDGTLVHNTGCDSRILGNDLTATVGPRGVGDQAAHVVPTGAFSNRSAEVQKALEDSRRILASAGIDINSAANGFWATAGHGGTHTDKFFLDLGDKLRDAEIDGTVASTLEAIRAKARAGGYR